MLLTYEWLASNGEAPETGTRLKLSGDPDRPVLDGTVARQVDGEDGVTVLSIVIPDRQNGSLNFQHWVQNDGEIGIKLDDRSGPVLL